MKILANTSYFSLIFLLVTINGCEKDEDKSLSTVSDASGNVYKTVKIGSQVWMAENLKTTVFNDKGVIPNVTSPDTWVGLISPGYCFYDNVPSYKDSVGIIYNWFAANSGKLCPVGWHVPRDSDFVVLELTLGMSPEQTRMYGWHGTDQGAQLKSVTGWENGHGNATNSSHFTALPGGYRHHTDGIFSGLGIVTMFWTSSDDSYNGKPLVAWYLRLDDDEKKIYKGTTNKQAGHYIRCIKD
jgi:uncharacterized protein (TIGR02145 family)